MGKFVGDVVAKWTGAGREQVLVEEFMFIDNNKALWVAPKYSIIDGASIPRIFWFFIGSPFVGKFRRASVIHDVYCNNQTIPHKDVHKMFYNAMLCDGVGKVKAFLMYKAVQIGGPKW